MKNYYYGQGIYRTAKQLIRKIINRRLLKNPYFDKAHHLLACLFYQGVEERIIGYLNPLWIINDIGAEELTVLVKIKNGDMSDFLFSAIYFIQGLNIRYFFISPGGKFFVGSVPDKRLSAFVGKNIFNDIFHGAVFRNDFFVKSNIPQIARVKFNPFGRAEYRACRMKEDHQREKHNQTHCFDHDAPLKKENFFDIILTQ